MFVKGGIPRVGAWLRGCFRDLKTVFILGPVLEVLELVLCFPRERSGSKTNVGHPEFARHSHTPRVQALLGGRWT